MVARHQRAPFVTDAPFVARRAFRFDGTDYAPGDAFPWRELDCSAAKLRRLYDGRFVECSVTNEVEDVSLPDDVVATGRGWFEVRIPGREPEKVRGRKAAIARLEELRAAAAV